MPHSKAASMESNSVPKVIDGVVESLVNTDRGVRQCWCDKAGGTTITHFLMQRSDYQLESLRPQKGVELRNGFSGIRLPK